ncbi:hypothetical protein FOL46_006391 [Perkinsus olseni]|uniref:RRM domain-containing protein n=1 Tax=Perkinsus olseni TaxID=32597 RepID=A0A7J6MQF3_PEROL|nr:hypothetical protein FOL46_006391 [Perkinsus olseni]
MAPPGWDQQEPSPATTGAPPPDRAYESTGRPPIEPSSREGVSRTGDHGRREHSRRRRGGSDSSSSSRSRSRGRRDKRRSRRDRSRSERRRPRKSGWDDSTEPSGHQSNFSSQALGSAGLDATTLMMQQQVLAGGAGQNKKAKELYVGNLAKGQANMANIKEFFNAALTALPEYQQKYSQILPAGCIREVRLSPCGQYCFVEFASEEICLTALEFDRVEFLGRQLRIARPSGYTPLGPPPPPMDVSVLRVQGFLPQKAMAANPQQDKKQREVYVGNLASGLVTPQVLKDLFEPACKVLPDYNAALGPPVLTADVRGEGRFAFVEFQNDKLCTAAIDIFNGMEVLGRRLVVGRPQGYVEPVEGPAIPTGHRSSPNPMSTAGGWDSGQSWGMNQGWGAAPAQDYRGYSQRPGFDGAGSAVAAGAEAAQSLIHGYPSR